MDLEFAGFEDASVDFEESVVWSLRLRDEQDREFEALYFPGEFKNFIIRSRDHLRQSEAEQISLAAFSHLSVILINPEREVTLDD